MARQKPILCKTVSIESYPLQLEGQGEGLGWQKTVAKHTQSLQWVVKLSHWLLHCFCGTDAAAQEWQSREWESGPAMHPPFELDSGGSCSIR